MSLAGSKRRSLRYDAGYGISRQSRPAWSTFSVVVHDDDGDLCDRAQRCAGGRVLDDNVE